MNISFKTIAMPIILLVVVVVGVLFLLSRPTSFELTDTSPQQDSSGNDMDLMIEFTYSQDLEAGQTVEYNSSPAIDAETRIDGSSLYIIPKHRLLEATEYMVDIPSVTSEDGSQADPQTLTFSTKQDDSPRAQFIRELPYYGNGFNITYIKNSDVFIVQITSGTPSERQEAALDYMERQGVDTETDNIELETFRESETSGSPAG